MLNLNRESTTSGSRFDSDRDVLPFPAGGVFGPKGKTTPNETRSGRKTESSMNLADSISADLNALQAGLDRLTIEIHEDEARDALAAIPFKRFQSSDPSGPSSPAA
jgi:hypothetical protein